MSKINKNPFTYKLDEPFEWEGVVYEELNLDPSELRGKDYIGIMNKLNVTC